jgi:hypothetical protein
MSSSQVRNTLLGSSTASTVMEALETYPPCRFPSLVNAGTTAGQEQLSLETAIVDVDDIVNFCTSQNVSVASLIKAAWAVVLRGYTGTTSISFGIQGNAESDADTDIGLMTTSNASIFGATLDLSHSLLEMVRRVHSSEQCSTSAVNQDTWDCLVGPSTQRLCNSEIRLSLSQQDNQERETEFSEMPSVCNSLSIYNIWTKTMKIMLTVQRFTRWRI